MDQYWIQIASSWSCSPQISILEGKEHPFFVWSGVSGYGFFQSFAHQTRTSSHHHLHHLSRLFSRGTSSFRWWFHDSWDRRRRRKTCPAHLNGMRMRSTPECSDTPSSAPCMQQTEETMLSNIVDTVEIVNQKQNVQKHDKKRVFLKNKYCL